MPYSSNDELPEQVRNAASSACQTIFRNAFNSIESDNSDLDEGEIFQRAWGAMQNSCGRASEDEQFTRNEANMQEHDTVSGGLAVLSTATDDGPTIVHGVAMGEDDTSKGMSGVETQWPGDVLKEAAPKLRGKPLVEGHPGVEKTDSGLSVDPQPPVSSVVGEVTKTSYKDGVGILFEAEVDNEDIAAQIENGRADVSPIVRRKIAESDNGNAVAEQIAGFRDLGVVVDGASPSNSISMGASAMAAEALASEFDTSGDDGESDSTPSSTGDSNQDSTDDDSNMSFELQDGEKEVLQEYRAMENPILRESDEKEALESDLEDVTDDLADVKAIFAEALSEKSGMSAETLESLPWSALRAEFEDEDGDIDAEALVQEPETQHTGEGGADSDDDESPFEALSGEDKEKVKNYHSNIKYWEGKDQEGIVDANKNGIVDVMGLDSYDEFEPEVL